MGFEIYIGELNFFSWSGLLQCQSRGEMRAAFKDLFTIDSRKIVNNLWNRTGLKTQILREYILNSFYL